MKEILVFNFEFHTIEIKITKNFYDFQISISQKFLRIENFLNIPFVWKKVFHFTSEFHTIEIKITKYIYDFLIAVL